MLLKSGFFFNFILFNNFFRYIYIYNVLNFNFKKEYCMIHFNFINIFISYKFFIVSKNVNFFLQKRIATYPLKKFNNFFVLYSYFFLKNEYKNFVNFLYKVFFTKTTIFFLTLTYDIVEFNDFFQYIYNPKLYFLYKNIIKFRKYKETRTKIKKIINYIYSKFKIKITFVFDEKLSTYIVNFVRSTDSFLIGFEYGYHRKNFYHYSIFLLNYNYIFKYLIIKQISECYYFATIQLNLNYCKYFLMLSKNFINF